MIHAAHVRERIGQKRLGGRATFQMLYGYPPDISNMKVWGCNAWGLVPKARRTKWDSRAIRGIYVGDSSDKKARMIYEPTRKRMLETPHVIFDEGALCEYPEGNQEQPAGPAGEAALPSETDSNVTAEAGHGQKMEKTLPPIGAIVGICTVQESN